MKKIIIILFIWFLPKLYSQVGIGTVSPHDSSILDVSSVQKGILVPRMTEAERLLIASPATGLLIYNTTSGVFQYNKGDAITPDWFSVNAENTLTRIDGYVLADGSSVGSSGFTTTRTGTGNYRVTFDTPQLNATYSAIVTVDRASGRDDLFVGVANRTITYFDVYISDEDDGGSTNNYTDNIFSFVVYFN